MTNKEIIDIITHLMCDVLDVTVLSINETTTASDIDEWDSLNHAILISKIQKEFKIKFKLKEVLKFNNVGDMCTAIKSKL